MICVTMRELISSSRSVFIISLACGLSSLMKIIISCVLPEYLDSQVPGMLVTCSIDKTVALWDTTHSPAPQPCGSKDMNVGKLYSVSCYPSLPWLLACGGSGNDLAIWDMEGEDAIQRRFAGRINGGAVAAVGSSNNGDGNEEPNFEALMATEGNDAATSKALEGMDKSKKKKGKGNKKKGKAHSKRK